MLDLIAIRDNPERITAALAKRGTTIDMDALLDLDQRCRGQRTDAEKLRADRGRLTRQIAALRRHGAPTGNLQTEAAALGERIGVAQNLLADLEAQRATVLDALPNLVDDDVPAGGKENNLVLRVAGTPPQFDFAAKDHVTLAQDLKLIDYQRGALLAGTGFWVYHGAGALLEWALLNYFIDAHYRDGFEFILPPHLLTPEAGYTAGQFPKFADDVFQLPGGDGAPGAFLLPTSETALVNLHRGETLPAAELPARYFAFSPCYRREAGGYRTTERGTLRGHQFHKVEMFAFTAPADSDAVHAELLDKAERLVAGLGLHYRVTRLAAGDTSAAMAKTFDVEVFLPSVDDYVEVSSVSNARDFQARRGKIRYRGPDGETGFVHTLNASGLATSRLLPAILEQHQRADGTVAVPQALRPWLPFDTLTASGSPAARGHHLNRSGRGVEQRSPSRAG